MYLRSICPYLIETKLSKIKKSTLGYVGNLPIIIFKLVIINSQCNITTTNLLFTHFTMMQQLLRLCNVKVYVVGLCHLPRFNRHVAKINKLRRSCLYIYFSYVKNHRLPNISRKKIVSLVNNVKRPNSAEYSDRYTSWKGNFCWISLTVPGEQTPCDKLAYNDLP